MFEWDEAKRQATLRKHGIDFVAATRVFDTLHIVQPARSDIEPRQIAIGDVDGVIIAVIFTMRGETTRLITARRARHHERENFRSLHVGGSPAHERPH